MSELFILNLLLLVAFGVAPIMTRRLFLRDSRIYLKAHSVAFLAALLGFIFETRWLMIPWPAFCVFGFALYLKNERRHLFSWVGAATCLPFVFSLISALWFISGTYDLKLLGYSPAWSFYAALHGAFIGWMLVGGLAFLAKTHAKRVYLLGAFLCLICFLLIAFGIDGVPYIKRVGVIGLSILIPFAIGLFTGSVWTQSRRAAVLAGLSLVAIVVSMSLAILNEFWIAAPRIAFGLPLMVITHGVLNALVAVPCFVAAVMSEANRVRL